MYLDVNQSVIANYPLCRDKLTLDYPDGLRHGTVFKVSEKNLNKLLARP